ncbi:hypothetical protein SNEBB_003057 [Seison nebaliae]|nr:hypothetical protein SNEBB_003057 [Seison nebaliae]
MDQFEYSNEQYGTAASVDQYGFDSNIGERVFGNEEATQYANEEQYGNINGELNQIQMQHVFNNAEAGLYAENSAANADGNWQTALRSESTLQHRMDDENEKIKQMNSEQLQYQINYDPNPQVIKKQNNENVEYKQEVAIRYLQPPTPPPPGPIIIKEVRPPPAPAAPPVIVRQRPPRPLTPPPIVVREQPPTQPQHLPPKIITKQLPRNVPPPRRVIVERLPPLPPKPRTNTASVHGALSNFGLSLSHKALAPPTTVLNEIRQTPSLDFQRTQSQTPIRSQTMDFNNFSSYGKMSQVQSRQVSRTVTPAVSNNQLNGLTNSYTSGTLFENEQFQMGELKNDVRNIVKRYEIPGYHTFAVLNGRLSRM